MGWAGGHHLLRRKRCSHSLTRWCQRSLLTIWISLPSRFNKVVGHWSRMGPFLPCLPLISVNRVQNQVAPHTLEQHNRMNQFSVFSHHGTECQSRKLVLEPYFCQQSVSRLMKAEFTPHSLCRDALFFFFDSVMSLWGTPEKWTLLFTIEDGKQHSQQHSIGKKLSHTNNQEIKACMTGHQQLLSKWVESDFKAVTQRC